MRARLAIAAIALGAAAPAAAAGITDLAEIDRAVAQFTGAPIGSPGGARQAVDRRLRLAHCPVAFALEWYGKARDTVLVRCPEAGGWRMFVPLNAGAAGTQAAAAIGRGEVVTFTVSGRGFSLSRQVEAMDAGAIGDWIRVRAIGKRAEPTRAQVLRPGLVGTELP